ncbi:hypothetical protein ACX0G7_09655 [Flavitalea antarctica]
MSLQPTTSSVKSGLQVWQKVFETVQGGLGLDTTGITGFTHYLPAGTPVIFDEATRLAKVLKTAEVTEAAGGAAVAYKVKKNHCFKVGDYLARVVGGAAYAITAIDTTTSTLYDTLTVGTTLGAAAVGAGLFQSSATGASAAALMYTPNGLTYDEYELGKTDSVSVVIRGTIYARRTFAQQASVKTALSLIQFSNSY